MMEMWQKTPKVLSISWKNEHNECKKIPKDSKRSQNDKMPKVHVQ